MVARLPNLERHLKKIQRAVREIPGAAAQAMVAAIQDDARHDVDPYGTPQPARQDGVAFDHDHHVTDSYHPVVVGEQAMVVADHHASRVLQHRYKGRLARLLRPQEGRGVGHWLPKISAAVGAKLRGR